MTRSLFGRLGIAFLILTLVAACAATVVDKPAAKVHQIKVAHSSISVDQGVAKLMKDVGIFSRNGLDAEVLRINGDTPLVQALIAGDIQFGLLSGPTVIQSRLQGSDLVLVGAVVNRLKHSLMVVPAIAKPEDLKGKGVGVSRLGSSSDFQTRLALTKINLDPSKDVTILQIGGTPERLAALSSGGIQAGLIDSESRSQALKLGLKELLDLSKSDIQYQGSAFAARKSFVDGNPEVMRKLTRSFADLLKFYDTDPEGVKKFNMSFLSMDDPKWAEEQYQTQRALLPRPPYPTEEGIRTILKESESTFPGASKREPGEFVDVRYLKELEAEGAFK